MLRGWEWWSVEDGSSGHERTGGLGGLLQQEGGTEAVGEGLSAGGRGRGVPVKGTKDRRNI